MRPAEEQHDALRRRRREGMYTPLRAMLTNEARQRLAQQSRCMSCGTSMTSAEWDLVRYAQAMNAALRMIRFIAESDVRDGMVPASVILQALDQPYRFPLPDSGDLRADAEDGPALAALLKRGALALPPDDSTIADLAGTPGPEKT